MRTLLPWPLGGVGRFSDDAQIRDHVCGRIQQLLLEQHMTVAQLAQRLGYGIRYTRKILNGQVIPDLVILRRLAEAFEVDESHFLEGELAPFVPRPRGRPRRPPV